MWVHWSRVVCVAASLSEDNDSNQVTAAVLEVEHLTLIDRLRKYMFTFLFYRGVGKVKMYLHTFIFLHPSQF